MVFSIVRNVKISHLKAQFQQFIYYSLPDTRRSSCDHHCFTSNI